MTYFRNRGYIDRMKAASDQVQAAAATCCLCAETALRMVDGRGYCRSHRAEADKARLALMPMNARRGIKREKVKVK